MKNYAIILASGLGKRFNSDLPKQFAKINGKTIFEYSIEAFEQNEFIDGIIIVIHPQYGDLACEIIKNNEYKKIMKVVDGGKERKDSSYIGVNAIKELEANVLIHDCARPFVSQGIINRCVNALKTHDAVAAAIPSTDTIIKVNNSIIEDIPQRSSLMRIQTPQCFSLSLIKKAHELSENDINFTDDCGLILKHNLSEIYIVEGSEKNIKITNPEDIDFASFVLQR